MTQVLIVENDEGNRFALHQMLVLQGHDVISVASGAAALNLLPTLPPGIVVLDYRMPVINGGDVMRFIAADAMLRRCHAVILVTASPHELPPATHALLTLLEAPLLSKPFIIDTLAESITVATRRLQAHGCLPGPCESEQ
ncbi:MAG: response regulator [Ktedonobacterales bacterium]|nr:response regulator [Ktedonobacterales bacterium]